MKLRRMKWRHTKKCASFLGHPVGIAKIITISMSKMMNRIINKKLQWEWFSGRRVSLWLFHIQMVSFFQFCYEVLVAIQKLTRATQNVERRYLCKKNTVRIKSRYVVRCLFPGCYNQISLTTQISWPLPDLCRIPAPDISRFPELPVRKLRVNPLLKERERSKRQKRIATSLSVSWLQWNRIREITDSDQSLATRTFSLIIVSWLSWQIRDWKCGHSVRRNT